MAEASTFDLAMCLDTPRATTAEQELADRLRMVLETQTGQLPYLPTFGCDLSRLVGRTVHQARLTEARLRISGALQRWMGDLDIVEVKTRLADVKAIRGPMLGVPIAEGAMASEAIAVAVEVTLIIRTPAGEVEVNALMTP